MLNWTSKIKTLGSESFVYGLSGIFSRLIGFFMLPFFARTLSTQDYGAIALLQSFFFLFSTISLLGLNSSVLRWYFDYDDAIYRKQVFSTAVIFQIFWAILQAILLFTLGVMFLSRNFHSYPGYLLFGIVGLNIVCNIIPTMLTGWCRLRHRPWMAISVGIGSSLLSFGFSFVFIIIYKWGVVGYFAGQTIAFLFTSIFSYVILRGWINFSYFKIRLLLKMLAYGIHVVPASLASAAMIFFTNLILQYNTSQSELGIYQMGVSFALIINLITNAFGQAWSPFSFSLINDPDQKKLYNASFQLYVAILLVVVLGLSLFSKELVVFVASKKFYESAKITAILSFAYFINSLSTIGITGMSLAKNIKAYSPIIIVSSVITLGLMLLLTPRYGSLGA